MKKLLSLLSLALLALNIFAQIKLNRPVMSPVSNSTAACCGFRAMNSADLPMGLSATKENTIVFDKETFDDANAFNGSSYKAPSDGVYQFTVNVGIKAKNSSSDISQLMLKIKTSNSQSTSQLINIPANYDNVISGQAVALFKLSAGEEVSVIVIGLGSASAATTGNLSYFSGVKMY